MANKYRSSITTQGKKMAGARALWRATGMKEEDFQKPIIAIANSFTQFVPGHVHLHSYGQMLKQMIDAAGGVGVEFNTIAIDDGIAMGHGGMLYSLPSRELIADSVEYMVQAHVADALICISSCDKITPGMLMAAMRLNIPTIFVTGGPMEAGKAKTSKGELSLDLVDAMVMAADDNINEQDLQTVELNACPTCGSCSGMFTANSMNCLIEALGMALPGNGTLLATHTLRKKLFQKAATQIVKMSQEHYLNGNNTMLPRSIATFEAFQNAMTLDIAMGGSTNTVLHILAIAQSAGVNFTMSDIDQLSRITPCLCKVSPNSKYHIEDVNRAGGIFGILSELQRATLINGSPMTVSGINMAKLIEQNDICQPNLKPNSELYQRTLAAPGGCKNLKGISQSNQYPTIDNDRKTGCIRNTKHAYSKDGGLCVLFGNIAQEGCIVKTAGVDKNILKFSGKAVVCDSQEEAIQKILDPSQVSKGDIVIIRYEGPQGGPGMQEMLYPTSYIKSRHIDKECALITDGRFSGGTSGLSIGHISPEAAEGGNIALIQDGDIIQIDINKRAINVQLSDQQLAQRRNEMNKQPNPWQPKRNRKVSNALKLFGLMATSAATGAVRDINKLQNKKTK